MSRRARAAGCSDFAHRYAEGHPGERYYRGTSYIDEIESQLKTNLKVIFECDHCEVRPDQRDQRQRGRVQPVRRPGRRGHGQLHPGRRAHQPPPPGLARQVHPQHHRLSR
ncbi:MAG: hypothetical protein M0C28_46850 [Candidatus Moduliflexus flocculans]|nr:hypothetical protein [Candidatus Moduliflexus flocculans]